MEILKLINFITSIVFVVCYAYQLVYIPIVLFFRRRKERKIAESRQGRETVYKDIAILICGRNEEKVIGDLLDSCKEQTYPEEHLKVFVMADNCTDNTADVSRDHGAIVYERFNDTLIGKGYALEELYGHLQEDYPQGFDGYLILDADNLLESNYVEKMNESLNDGHDVITSFRNSKNYSSSWISSGQGLWFLRESRYLNNARHILGISSGISGTGYMLSRNALSELGGKWPFHLLTEDLEYTAYLVTNEKKVAFCADAMFYDEQPITIKQSWRQRLRWTQGYLQVLRHYGVSLIKGIFKGSFSCFDTLMNIAPAYFLSFVSILANIIFIIVGLIQGGNPLDALQSIGELIFYCCSIAFLVGLITMITEWKIIRASVPRKIFSLITFPIYMLTFVPIAIFALFAKKSWKPVGHTVTANDFKKQ